MSKFAIYLTCFVILPLIVLSTPSGVLNGESSNSHQTEMDLYTSERDLECWINEWTAGYDQLPPSEIVINSYGVFDDRLEFTMSIDPYVFVSSTWYSPCLDEDGTKDCSGTSITDSSSSSIDTTNRLSTGRYAEMHWVLEKITEHDEGDLNGNVIDFPLRGVDSDNINGFAAFEETCESVIRDDGIEVQVNRIVSEDPDHGWGFICSISDAPIGLNLDNDDSLDLKVIGDTALYPNELNCEFQVYNWTYSAPTARSLTLHWSVGTSQAIRTNGIEDCNNPELILHPENNKFLKLWESLSGEDDIKEDGTVSGDGDGPITRLESLPEENRLCIEHPMPNSVGYIEYSISSLTGPSSSETTTTPVLALPSLTISNSVEQAFETPVAWQHMTATIEGNNHQFVSMRSAFGIDSSPANWMIPSNLSLLLPLALLLLLVLKN